MAHVEIGPTDDVQDSARAFAALEHVRDGVALMRPVRDDAGAVVDFVYAYLNRRGGGAAGASTLLGRRLLDVLPEFPRALFDGLVAVLAGGEPLHTNVDAAEVYVGHDAIAGRFRLEASRIGDSLLVVYADIGARASTSSLQERYGAVLEATSDWVSIADRDHNLVYVNAGGRQMVGIGLDEEIRGRRVGEFSPRWAREYVRRVALKVAREEGVWRGNLARLHRDGHEIPVSQVIVARTGEDGEVDFYATIARDMTGERAAQDALRASEERFRVAFEQAPIGFALLDLDGRYLQINDAYCRTVRHTREELTLRRPAEITHPEDVADSEHAVRRLVSGELEEYSIEKRYVGRDGETIWAQLSASVFRDSRGRPQFLIGMVQDIGERRLAHTLQRSMLTTQPPEIDGVQLAVRYRPGSPESEIGGDWFDVVPLAGGHIGIVVGDVVGRGIEAAVTMSQLRTALRAYAIDGMAPAEVVRKLHRLADHLDEGVGTTLVLLDLDPATGEMRYVSAGHLPALHVDAQGVSTFLPGGRSSPLGTLEPGVEIPQAALVLGPGETVLLYTDGLVERREEGIASRLEQLRAAMADAPQDLDAGLDHVMERLTGGDVRLDDIALLALRLR